MTRIPPFLLTFPLLLSLPACGDSNDGLFTTGTDTGTGASASTGGSSSGGSSAGGTQSGGTNAGGTGTGAMDGTGATQGTGAAQGSGGNGTGGTDACPPCAAPPSDDCVGSGPCGCGPYVCGTESCGEVQQRLSETLNELQACHPKAAQVQCTGTVLTICGCQVPINDPDSDLAAAYERDLNFIESNCSGEIACPAVLCFEPTTASCVQAGDGYTCVGTGFGQPF